MAEKEVNKVGLIEVANRTLPKDLLDIVNELVKKVPILRDAPFYECNQNESHKHTKVAAMPAASTRAMYEAASKSAAQTKSIIEPVSYIEEHSEIDEQVLKIVKNPQRFRYDEDMIHMEALRQKIGTLFLYGNHITDIKDIDGITTRYNALSLDNVWTCGGSGDDNTSLWFIKWGRDAVFCVYPSSADLKVVQRNDLGRQRIPEGSAGGAYYAFVTQFLFSFGIVVRNDKCIQRICNIEASGAANLIDTDKMIKAKNKMPDTEGVVGYCNDTVLSQLEIEAKDKPNVWHTTTDPWGKRVLNFYDIPVRKFDSLVNTETTVA